MLISWPTCLPGFSAVNLPTFPPFSFPVGVMRRGTLLRSRGSSPLLLTAEYLYKLFGILCGSLGSPPTFIYSCIYVVESCAFMFHIYKKKCKRAGPLGGLLWGGDRPSPTVSAALALTYPERPTGCTFPELLCRCEPPPATKQKMLTMG